VRFIENCPADHRLFTATDNIEGNGSMVLVTEFDQLIIVRRKKGTRI